MQKHLEEDTNKGILASPRLGKKLHKRNVTDRKIHIKRMEKNSTEEIKKRGLAVQQVKKKSFIKKRKLTAQKKVAERKNDKLMNIIKMIVHCLKGKEILIAMFYADRK